LGKGWGRFIPDQANASAPIHYISHMGKHRRDITARVVPLRSREAGEPPCPSTAAERIALVTRLAREMWALSGKPRPRYTRATMPVVVTRRGSHAQ